MLKRNKINLEINTLVGQLNNEVLQILEISEIYKKKLSAQKNNIEEQKKIFFLSIDSKSEELKFLTIYSKF